MTANPVLMLAWEFWRRHRIGLAAVALLIAGFSIFGLVGTMSKNAALGNSIWFVIALCYVVGVFAYGFEGKLETAESGFPARFFVLPVPTVTLVLGPMVQGIAVGLLMWLSWHKLVLEPSGTEMPPWSTAMLAAMIAVSQAIVWLPFGLPWLRILVAIFVLIALLRAPLILALAGVYFNVPSDEDRLLTGIALALVPLSFLAAWAGVSNARHGGGADWLQSLPRISRQTRAFDRTAFTSAMRAQIWFEWRTRGRGYVVIVACTLAILLSLAVLLQRQVGWHLMDNFVFVVVPLLIACFWGGFTGSASFDIRTPGMTTFAATRPITGTEMVKAKIYAMGLATLAAWMLVAVLISSWSISVGKIEEFDQYWQRLSVRYGAAKVVAGAIVNLMIAVLFTWRLLIASMWSGLSGRWWVMALQMWAFFMISFQVFYEMALWQDLERRERMLFWLTVIGVAAITAKLTIGSWALARLRVRNEISTVGVAQLVAGWLIFVAVMTGVLSWIVPRSDAAPYGIALWVLALTPLARLAVAPLALAWNRHR